MNQSFIDLEEYMNVEKRRATQEALAEIAALQRQNLLEQLEYQKSNLTQEIEDGTASPKRMRNLQFRLDLARAAIEVAKAPRKDAKELRLFLFLDLASQIIPTKTRTESFEPAYSDEKSDYLRASRRFTGGFARKWLFVCFVFRFLILVVQSFGAMCSEKGRKFLWAAMGGVVVWFRKS